MSRDVLAGQVALVTGGAGGIGAATAAAFVAAGAGVAVLDRDGSGAGALASRLQVTGAPCSAWPVDVSDEGAVDRAVAGALARHGRLDHAVLCAGILYNGLVADMPLERWRRTLEVNLTGSFLVARAATRVLLASAAGGTITFLASAAGKRGAAYGGAYCASKFGLLGLMESLAREVTPLGIRVNAVCPGDVETPMIAQNAQEMAEALGITAVEYRRRVLDAIPLGRMAGPEEVAAACVFLASPAASYISGVALNVDGGQLSG